jgi:hypothetical protein
VPDVEIAIGLGRKAGHYLGVAPGGNIGVEDFADKVATRLHRSGFFRHHISRCPHPAYVAHPGTAAKALSLSFRDGA